MIIFKCPTCLKTFKSPVADAGKKCPCPSCGQRLQIPAPVQPQNKTVLGELVPDTSLVKRDKQPDLVVESRRSGELKVVRIEDPPKTNRVNVPCPFCRMPVPMSVEQLNRSIRCQACHRDFVVHFAIQSVDAQNETPLTKKSDSPRAWIRVAVSAWLLRWPEACACCHRTPQIRRPVVCNRSDGKSLSWKVPYCAGCHALIEQGKAGESVRYESFLRSVHTFAFWSKPYADDFCKWNAEKLVRV